MSEEQAHHQILHFDNGTKRLILDVKYIWEGEMCHIIDSRGVEFVINKKRLLFVERFKKEEEEKKDDERKKR